MESGPGTPLDRFSAKNDAESVDFQPQRTSGSKLRFFDFRKVLVDVFSMEFIFRKPPDSCFQGKELFAKVPATIIFSGLYDFPT